MSSASEPAARHSRWTIALHWGTVLAIVLAVVAVLWREAIDDKDGKALRIVLMQLHRQAGLLVLLALAARLLVRWRVGLARQAQAASPWALRAAQAAHLGLYGLLLAMPLLGLALSQAHAVDVKLFGLLPLPTLVEEDPDLADRLDELHAWGAWLLGGLVAAHAGAALWHHFVQRDGVLRAMWPARGDGRTAADSTQARAAMRR